MWFRAHGPCCSKVRACGAGGGFIRGPKPGRGQLWQNPPQLRIQPGTDRFKCAVSLAGLRLLLVSDAGRGRAQPGDAEFQYPRTYWRQKNAAGQLSDTLRMRLVGGNVHAAVSGVDPQPGVVSYLIGNGQKKWNSSEQQSLGTDP